MRDDFYETEKDRIRRHIKKDLTPCQRLQNWWHYHWLYVVCALGALGVGLYLASNLASAPPADYCVAYVGDRYLDGDTQRAVEAAFLPLAEDVNGDGRTVVDLHQLALPMASILERGTSGQQEYADLLSLDADLNAGQSVIFLLEDPAAFQAYSGALLTPEGESPSEGTSGEALALPWDEVMDIPWPGETPAPSLALRGCWKEDQREHWEGSHTLWLKLIRR